MIKAFQILRLVGHPELASGFLGQFLGGNNLPDVTINVGASGGDALKECSNPFIPFRVQILHVLQNLFNKDKYHLKLFIICFVTLTNLVLTQETLKYLDANNGAHNSDYGKSYNICGCCTNVIKDCRGQ